MESLCMVSTCIQPIPLTEPTSCEEDNSFIPRPQDLEDLIGSNFEKRLKVTMLWKHKQVKGEVGIYTRAVCVCVWWCRGRVLQQSDGIEEQGTIIWQLALILLFAWTLVYLCLFKGVRWTGKVRANCGHPAVEENAVLLFLMRTLEIVWFDFLVL